MNEQNMMEPQYRVSESSLIRKYRSDLEESTFKRLLAEAAVDDLIERNHRLTAELRGANEEKEGIRVDFNKQLEEVRAQLNDTLGARDE